MFDVLTNLLSDGSFDRADTNSSEDDIGGSKAFSMGNLRIHAEAILRKVNHSFTASMSFTQMISKPATFLFWREGCIYSTLERILLLRVTSSTDEDGTVATYSFL